MGKRKRRSKPLSRKSGVLVFAYGSNLDIDQMHKRCPESEVVGRAYLRNYKLGFCGYSVGWRGAVATVSSSIGNSVPGVLYLVSRSDLKYLDACEGHPTIYKRRRIKVDIDGGKKIWCQIYIRQGGLPGRPSVAYFRAIYHGYRLWGFGESRITRLLERALA